MKKRFERHRMRKKPGTPALYSFLIPGVGQIYNREVAKGVVMILISVALVISFFLVHSWYLQKTQLVYSEATKIMDQLNIEEQIAELYKSTQIKIRLSHYNTILFIPIFLYFSLATFSCIDAYFFAIYIALTIDREETLG